MRNEKPDSKEYMKKISWNQIEVQRKLMSIKSGKQPGTDKVQ